MNTHNAEGEGTIKKLQSLVTSALRAPTAPHLRVGRHINGLLDILAHPNPGKYPRQKLLVVACDGYAYLVPFVEQDDHFFLKTVIPSRKATRDYLKPGEDDAKD